MMTLGNIDLRIQKEFDVGPPSSGDPNSRYVSVTTDYKVELQVLGFQETPPRVIHCEITSGLVPHQTFLDGAENYYSSQASFLDIGLSPDAAANFAQISREVVNGDPNRRVVSFLMSFQGEMLLPSSAAIEQYTLEFETALYASAVNGKERTLERSTKYISPEGTTEEECPICLQEFGKALPNDNNRDRRIVRTPCSHVYHKHCIVQWLKRNNKCPLCRCEMRLGD